MGVPLHLLLHVHFSLVFPYCEQITYKDYLHRGLYQSQKLWIAVVYTTQKQESVCYLKIHLLFLLYAELYHGISYAKVPLSVMTSI
jgi:succinate dehydrogenase/fumarate reductase cytochrome b subunit